MRFGSIQRIRHLGVQIGIVYQAISLSEDFLLVAQFAVVVVVVCFLFVQLILTKETFIRKVTSSAQWQSDKADSVLYSAV